MTDKPSGSAPAQNFVTHDKDCPCRVCANKRIEAEAEPTLYDVFIKLRFALRGVNSSAVEAAMRELELLASRAPTLPMRTVCFIARDDTGCAIFPARPTPFCDPISDEYLWQASDMKGDYLDDTNNEGFVSLLFDSLGLTLNMGECRALEITDKGVIENAE